MPTADAISAKAGLVCPRCRKRKFRVLRTRRGVDSIRRRRECLGCQLRFWGEEKITHIG